MPFKLGWPEIVVILVIVLIIFGVGKLPQIGGAIGKSLKEFRRAKSVEDNPETGHIQNTAKSSGTETEEKTT